MQKANKQKGLKAKKQSIHQQRDEDWSKKREDKKKGNDCHSVLELST